MKLNFLLAANLLCAASLFAQSGKLAPDLAGLDPNDNIDVIIQLEDTPAPRPGATRLTRPLALGGVNLAAQRPVRELGLINGLAARLPVASLASLAADARVKYVSPDREVSARTHAALAATNVTLTHTAGFTGKGIGIAVIDSGIALHNDLLEKTCITTSHRIRYSEDFVPPPANQPPPVTLHFDTYGHGTHIAGIIAGDGNCGGKPVPPSGCTTGVSGRCSRGALGQPPGSW